VTFERDPDRVKVRAGFRNVQTVQPDGAPPPSMQEFRGPHSETQFFTNRKTKGVRGSHGSKFVSNRAPAIVNPAPLRCISTPIMSVKSTSANHGERGRVPQNLPWAANPNCPTDFSCFKISSNRLLAFQYSKKLTNPKTLTAYSLLPKSTSLTSTKSLLLAKKLTFLWR